MGLLRRTIMAYSQHLRKTLLQSNPHLSSYRPSKQTQHLKIPVPFPCRSLSQSPSFCHKPQNQQQPHPPANPSLGLTNLFKELKGPYRWIIYAGLALAASAETTFWARVIYAKFFAKEDDRAADELLMRFGEAIRGYRQRYLVNYRRYHSENLWGL
jgi:hypothetical protein